MQRKFLLPHELPPPTWVEDAEGLNQLVRALTGEPVVAVDTESNSLYAYRERVCLMQFSTRERDFVLDPLRFEELDPLKHFFADPDQEKVFHAAEYDILCLKRDFGFRFAGIFDTMVAARTLGWRQVGLAAVLEAKFEIKMNKKHQRADWSRRPLPADQLEYARLDTHYLPALRDELLNELRAADRLEEARDEFQRIARVRPVDDGIDPHGFWRISGARDLSPESAAVLRELYLFRERRAESADRPPFKIMSDRTLLEIALHCPRRMEGLKSAHGMTYGQIRRYGEGLLKAVHRGLNSPPPRLPRAERYSYKMRENYRRLYEWRKEKARVRGVESDVILPREVLWDVAQLNPSTAEELRSIESLGPWRYANYGEEILALLQERRPPNDGPVKRVRMRR